MNDFTKIFRTVAYELFEDGLQEKEAKTEEQARVNKLFKQAFPDEMAETTLIMDTINMMQYVFAMFLLQVRAENVLNHNPEDINNFLTGMGIVLLHDLESGQFE